ncbi:MAG TPA: SpoIIE family protein phosphatase [Thermoanaerobaculia bacterium]
MKTSLRRALLVVLGAALTLAFALAGISYVSVIAQLTLGAGAVVLGLWLLWKGYRSYLWKVSRRLAFSYFLIGMLPIPIVLLLLGVGSYILSGFFLGHLYRDAEMDLQADLGRDAEEQLDGLQAARPADVSFAFYRNGRKTGGAAEAPAQWPVWAGKTGDTAPPRQPRFFSRPDGTPTLLAAAARGGDRMDRGVLALFSGNLDRAISRRAGLWVAIRRPDDPDVIRIEILNMKIPLRRIRKDRQPGEAATLFKEVSRGEAVWDDPLLWWAEVSGPLRDPATGRGVQPLTVVLNSTPRNVLHQLFTSAGEIDTSVWVALLVFAALLFDVYAVATGMAVFMIFSLSRAVNRMSQATDAVRRGDFAARIPVKRQDQVGDLQRSFNEMAGNLETLVAAEAQKEILENEIGIARDVQKSLIPRDLPGGEGVEFATLFEPSAAIGGDYFDVLRISEDELAVIIADVSGHGLSTGLRMAMLKAALLILVEQTREPEDILRRLDAVVRNGNTRVFVTATLTLINLRTGTLRIHNAGHPPTYLLRGGEIEEILLPGSPLGGLGHTYGRADRTLHRGDVLIWLSDGLIEATNAGGEPFGYDAVLKALQGNGKGGNNAADVRNRLLAAVDRYVGDEPPSDDRTLVVMRYRGRPGVTGEMRIADLAVSP